MIAEYNGQDASELTAEDIQTVIQIQNSILQSSDVLNSPDVNQSRVLGTSLYQVSKYYGSSSQLPIAFHYVLTSIQVFPLLKQAYEDAATLMMAVTLPARGTSPGRYQLVSNSSSHFQRALMLAQPQARRVIQQFSNDWSVHVSTNAHSNAAKQQHGAPTHTSL